MAVKKRVFTLRMGDEIFDKIGRLATSGHRSMTNYIEYILLEHLRAYEAENGLIMLEDNESTDV